MINSCEKQISFAVLCGNKDVDDSELNVENLNGWSSYSNHTNVVYLSSSGKKFIQTLSNEYKPDLIYIVGIYGWTFVIYPLLFLKARHKIISVRGMLHPGALSQKKWKKFLYLKILKLLLNKNKVSFHVTDAYEASLVRNNFGSQYKIHIASNIPMELSVFETLPKKIGSLSLLSVCLISPMKNILTVLESLQLCKHQIIYTIVGPIKDVAYWNKCVLLIQNMPENVSVHVVGEVSPDNLSRFYQQAHLFILPSKSENYGHAIIEALQSSLPVITSHHTPWSNLKEKMAGLNVTAEPNGILDAIHHFAIMNHDSYVQWRKGAIEYAAEKVNRAAIVQQYMDMFSYKQQSQEC